MFLFKKFQKKKLIIYQYDSELCVYLFDQQSVVLQDVCLVKEHYINNVIDFVFLTFSEFAKKYKVDDFVIIDFYSFLSEDIYKLRFHNLCKIFNINVEVLDFFEIYKEYNYNLNDSFNILFLLFPTSFISMNFGENLHKHYVSLLSLYFYEKIDFNDSSSYVSDKKVSLILRFLKNYFECKLQNYVENPKIDLLVDTTYRYVNLSVMNKIFNAPINKIWMDKYFVNKVIIKRFSSV